MKRYLVIIICSLPLWPAQAQDELVKLLGIAGENNSGLASQTAALEASQSRSERAGAWEDPRLSVVYFIQPIETRTSPQRWRFPLSQ